MSLSKLPNGRWRAQVYFRGRNVSAAKVLGHDGSYATKREAKAAREDARRVLDLTAPSTVTVSEWVDRWTTDPLFARPKASTNIHNAERVRRFAATHGDLPLADVDDRVVAAWVSGARNLTTVPALRAMFNDACSAKGGRIIDGNPFAGLGISKGRGNADKAPPSEQQVWAMIAHARALTSPAFAAWLQVAAFTGCRPGELDALEWGNVDFGTNRISVARQFSATSRTFTAPKNGRARTIVLTPQARDALLTLPREGAFCFENFRGGHFTPSARAYHWKAVRAKAGLEDKSLYVCTRHFAGWYMVNVLEMDSEDVAIQLGHEDGGELVRRLYGHRDRRRALARLEDAFNRSGEVRPLRVVGNDG